MEKLNVELKKKYKGGVKEFACLSRVEDYIRQEYGEIIDTLNSNDIEEILFQELKVETVVVYKDVETPIVVDIDCYEIYEATGGKIFGEKFYCFVENIRSLVTTNWERIDGKHSLKDLYYVSDKKLLETQREEYRVEEHKGEIKMLQESEVKRVEVRTEQNRIREKYGLPTDESIEFASAFEKFENTTDEIERYNLFVEATRKVRYTEAKASKVAA